MGAVNRSEELMEEAARVSAFEEGVAYGEWHQAQRVAEDLIGLERKLRGEHAPAAKRVRGLLLDMVGELLAGILQHEGNGWVADEEIPF